MTGRSIDRRRFLALAAAAALAPRELLAAAGPRRRMLQQNGYPLNAETPLELLDSYLTPVDLFFVRHHWIPANNDPAEWRLTIDGGVSRPLELSLDDLRRLPQERVTCVLQCAGNGRALFDPPMPGIQWRYGAVGNAQWTGVRVRTLLEKAGLRAGAGHLRTSGTDRPPGSVPPFRRSLEIEKALADAIVAVEMNGRPLPHLHGAPARLVVPGWAGDHWMKWLARLTVSKDPETGFYMDTGYRFPLRPGAPGVTFKPQEMRPVTELFVKSCITSAPTSLRAGATSTVRGFAFSGAPDVARVEWSEDGGATWREAELDPRHDPYAWRLWSFRWTPARAGRATLTVRATDSRGSVQPREAVWNQSGYLHNGWHSVEVEVTA